MNRVLVNNYIIYTLPIRAGHRVELDMEEIVLGNIPERDKTCETYLENEFEIKSNEAVN